MEFFRHDQHKSAASKVLFLQGKVSFLGVEGLRGVDES